MHDSSHHHSHSHVHHTPNSYNKVFLIGVSLNSLYVIIEIFYGFSINSLSLIADSLHNLSDIFSLLIAWAGYYLSNKLPDKQFTYGFKGSSILASFINSLMLILMVVVLSWEAINRFLNPVKVPGDIVMVVAVVGVFINGATALFFIKGKDQDINIKGAFLHMAYDALVSIGVVIGGFITLKYGYYLVDPIIGVLISVVILFGTISILKESTSMVINGVPWKVDYEKILNYLKNLEEVSEVHDLHIWAISTTEVALTCHLVIPSLEDSDKFLVKVCNKLKNDFDIIHPTLQIERNVDNFCPLKDDCKAI